jgi:two-component system phosphate regulon sensor histidine kinase PhoR
LNVGIRAKLFFGALLLIAVAIAAADFYLSRALETQLTARIRADLVTRAALIADRAAAIAEPLDERISDALADTLGQIAHARVTLIRPDGVVVGDSEVPREQLGRVENHAGRSEVVEAHARGAGSSIRFSATVGRRMMYVAVPIRRRTQALGTARVALPLVAVDEAIAQMRATLGAAAAFALAVAALVSFSAAELTSRRLRDLTGVARRMASGDLAARTRTSGHDEIVALGDALDQLAGSLSASLGELRGERDLLTSTLTSMNEGVLVVGAGGRIVLTNPALRAMLLIGPDAVGQSLREVMRDAELDSLLERAARGDAAEGELELAGLVRRRALVRAVMLQDEPHGVLAVFVDVTDLRKLEAVRRDFVANASHELRSPLTSIRAAAETLQDIDDDPQAAKRFVDVIQRNAERLSNLVDDLLELSRIESRELRLELESVDLHAAADRAFAQHAHRAQLKHIAFAHDVPRALAASADRRALDHVFGNLVDNALKYCPQGAAVRVHAAREGAKVRVAVCDDGPGIPPEHLERVFERFYRVDSGRSREPGTGLGLSIVKHLVEAMGGEVFVQSRPGAGTTFSFTLHAASAREAA